VRSYNRRAHFDHEDIVSLSKEATLGVTCGPAILALVQYYLLVGGMALGVSRHIKDCNLSLGANSKPFNPALFEKLEPRILLSADGLLIAAVPDPVQDSTQPMVQHAELLEANEQVGQQPSPEREIHQEVDSSNQLETDLWQPVLTLSVEDSSIAEYCEPINADADSVEGFNGVPGDAGFDEIGPVQSSEDIAGPVNDSGGDKEDTGTLSAVAEVIVDIEVTTNEIDVSDVNVSIPIYTGDADSSFEFTTSI